MCEVKNNYHLKPRHDCMTEEVLKIQSVHPISLIQCLIPFGALSGMISGIFLTLFGFGVFWLRFPSHLGLQEIFDPLIIFGTITGAFFGVVMGVISSIILGSIIAIIFNQTCRITGGLILKVKRGEDLNEHSSL